MKKVLLDDGVHVLKKKDGQLLFFLNDVAKCFAINNVEEIIKDFNRNQIVEITSDNIYDLLYYNGEKKYLTISGVYKLAFMSNEPKVQEFTDWIVDEVLPSILNGDIAKVK